MALNDTEQLKNLIEKSKHILVVFRRDSGGDGISSSAALALFLEKQGKHVDVVSDNFVLPRKFTFLKRAETIKTRMPHLQKFIVSLDIKNMGLQELSYDVKDSQLHIYITPQHGFFTAEHIRTAQTNFRYDLIITLDTPDFESLGDLYTNNTELFYRVPIVNIDASPSNEHYGTINLVDITSTSTSEVVANIIKDMNEALIDKDIATALLTGMISHTQSFKSKNVKPQTLALASKLVGIGADREFIIDRLYRTKTLSTLKLWGQALSHLQFDTSLGLVTTTLTRDDFTRSGAHEYELYDIIDELILNSPEAKMVLMLHETKQNETPAIQAIFRTVNGFHAKQLLHAFTPQGDKKQVSFTVTGKTLQEVEDMVQNELKVKLNP